MMDPCGNSTNSTLLTSSSNRSLCNVLSNDNNSSTNGTHTEHQSAAPTMTPTTKQTSNVSSENPSLSSPATMPTNRPMAPSSSLSTNSSSSQSVKPATSQSAQPTDAPTFSAFFPTAAPTVTLSSTTQPYNADRCDVCSVLYGTELKPAAYNRGVLDRVGSRSTCQGFDAMLKQFELDSPLCLSYDGHFNDIDVSAYCGCPGSQFPNACQLCPGGIINRLKLNTTVDELTCAEWYDWARATVERDACRRLTRQQTECCSF